MLFPSRSSSTTPLSALARSPGPRRFRASIPARTWNTAGLLATMVATVGCLAASLPAKAYQVFFNAPNVLGGIRNVPITLPSTGLTSLYDVILKKGTLDEIYGVPPSTDVDNAADAQALMEKSAAGINDYLNANIGTPLYFAVSGETGYLIPYGSPYTNPSGERIIGVSISIPRCLPGFYWDPVNWVCKIYTGILEKAPQITPVLGEFSAQAVTVWADVQPVPAPLPLAGGLVGWNWARRLRRRSHGGLAVVLPSDSQRPHHP